MKDFIIEKMPNKADYETDNLMVKQTSTGWFVPNLGEIEAQHICDKFNEILSEPLDLHHDFVEYENYLDIIKEGNVEMDNINEKYAAKSEKILNEVKKIKDETGEDIIKTRYGGNNKDTRKKYLEEERPELAEINEKKKNLKWDIKDAKRRISFFKLLISMKIKLMDYDGGRG